VREEVKEIRDRELLKEEFTKEEVKLVIKKLKKGKAMGLDKIPNEFLIDAAGDVFVELLRKLMNGIRMVGYIPESWRESRIILLHKGGEKRLLDNHRGIAIGSNLRKVFTRLLATRLEDDVDLRDLLGLMQYGFRRGWRATNAIFILTGVIEEYNKKKRRLAMAFLDIRKAYDKVWREGLWRVWRSISESY
jgi:hypothetical protein